MNWLKTLFQSDSDDSQEKLIQVKDAILRELADRIRPLPDGRSYFPATRLTVQLHAESDEQRLDYEKTFCERQSLEKRLRDELRYKGVEQDGLGLDISVEVVREKGADWRHPHFNLVARHERKSPVVALLTIQQGQTETGQYRLGSQTHVGRTKEPRNSRSGIMTRNEVAFDDIKNGVNETVSRWHARILLDTDSDEYRIYDDDSRAGTYVERGGTSFPVKGPRGTALQHGDIIHFGEAIARFTIVSQDEDRSATGAA